MLRNHLVDSSILLIWFAVILIAIYGWDQLVQYFIPDKFHSFLISHAICILFINTHSELCWFLLTIAHGIAHILHPAFITSGVSYIPNIKYTPLFDYYVHSLQCLCAIKLGFHNSGILMFLVTLLTGIYAHLHPEFLQSFLWIILSFGGVYGSIFHMLILTPKEIPIEIMYFNSILWFIPYIGYLTPFLVDWDRFVNQIGLFRLWYLTYFFFLRLILPKDR